MKKLRDRSQAQQGFTLIELLLVLALVGIVLAIGYRLFLSQSRLAGKRSCKSAYQ